MAFSSQPFDKIKHTPHFLRDECGVQNINPKMPHGTYYHLSAQNVT
jgi:hypothetical protein